MGVRVRLTRNSSAYFPFWLAIPVMLIWYTIVLAVLVVAAVVWLVIVLPAKGIGALIARRRDEAFDRERNAPEAVATREAARADRAARTHRFRVTECNIDALEGGEFTLAGGKDDSGDDLDIHVKLTPSSAMSFISLRKGDVVQATIRPDQTGLESFYQLARANGATPRSPIELGESSMPWLSWSGGQDTDAREGN
jgi:hypothetical protein